MVLQSSVELQVRYSGFLSMMETWGSWQRRWCCLKGHVISYWNYPLEELNKVRNTTLIVKPFNVRVMQGTQ
jgi:hypothetical protein